VSCRRLDWLRVTYGSYQEPRTFACSLIETDDSEREIGCQTQQGEASFPCHLL
jgi:hypothetical protein